MPDDWQWCYFGGIVWEVERLSEHVYRQVCNSSGHAYAVRGPLIGELADTITNPHWRDITLHHVDQMYINYQKHTRPRGLYCPSRWLFNQRDTFSNIQERVSHECSWPDPRDVRRTGARLVPNPNGKGLRWV